MELRVPKRYVPLVSWLTRSGQFTVRAGREGQVLLSGEGPLGTWSVFDSAPAALANAEQRPFVIAHRLSRGERELLEEHEIPFVDAAGHLFLTDGPVLLRVDDPTLRKAPLRVDSAPGLGYAGVRIAQELFADPGRAWTISAVEEAASVSKGRASQVLQLLDQTGLTEKHGNGRNVRDRAALLDWLSSQPKSRRSRPRVECGIYAQDELDAADRVRARLTTAAIGFALTGSVAAQLRGAGVSSSFATWVRVDPSFPLPYVAEQLEASPVRAGGNVVLIHDIGHVGYVGGTYPREGKQLAREARIYLDLFSEPRGESAAELFRDLLLSHG